MRESIASLDAEEERVSGDIEMVAVLQAATLHRLTVDGGPVDAFQVFDLDAVLINDNLTVALGNVGGPHNDAAVGGPADDGGAERQGDLFLCGCGSHAAR